MFETKFNIKINTSVLRIIMLNMTQILIEL